VPDGTFGSVVVKIFPGKRGAGAAPPSEETMGPATGCFSLARTAGCHPVCTFRGTDPAAGPQAVPSLFAGPTPPPRCSDRHRGTHQAMIVCVIVLALLSLLVATEPE